MSDNVQPAVIVEPDDFIRGKLQTFLTRMGVGNLCTVVDVAPEDFTPSSVFEFGCPVRPGAILNRIRAYHHAPGYHSALLHFGAYCLDTRQNFWMNANGTSIRLTEKEALLLQILKAAEGESVSRETLLDKVWRYADGVETHTLETHIYRLRQKIEDDPAEPKIVVTDEAGGYFLAL